MQAQVSQTAPVAPARWHVTPIHAITAGMVVGIAAMMFYIQLVLLTAIEVPLLVFGTLSLVIAGITLIGWRWTPILSTAWSALILATDLPHTLSVVGHPEDTHTFAVSVLFCVIQVLGVVFGLWASIQNYRLPLEHRTAPRWLPAAFAALITLWLGGVAVAAIPQENSALTMTPLVESNLPVFTINDFNDGVVRVRDGEIIGLRLQSDNPTFHTFDIDALDIHAPMVSNSESVLLFDAAPGEYFFYCDLHYDKETGEGMKGTLIVEP